MSTQIFSCDPAVPAGRLVSGRRLKARITEMLKRVQHEPNVKGTGRKLPAMIIFISLFFFSSCKKEEVKYEYGVNTVAIQPNNIEKTRLKSTDQYVAILYTNLFQKALSSNQLFQISQCFDSVGAHRPAGVSTKQILHAQKIGGSLPHHLPTLAQQIAHGPVLFRINVSLGENSQP
jgi:hypothetical protein